jgi:hypothetical protein
VLVKTIGEQLLFNALKPAPVARNVPSFVNDVGDPLQFPKNWQFCPLAADIVHSPRFRIAAPTPMKMF